MTFDEAWKQILENSIPFQLPDEGGDAEIFLSDLMNIFDDLRQEYAPTVKMAKKERINFLNAKNSGKSFYDLWGHYKLNSNNSLGRNYNEEQLMQAWLHPETIKVIDRGVQ